jgi:iron complex outermembrane receptor protein
LRDIAMKVPRSDPQPVVATILAASLAASTPSQVTAQPRDILKAPRGSLEEIVVTARRREERLHDVPIAMSVFGWLDLEQRQIVDLSGLQFAAPSLVITTDQTNRATSLIAMRGQFEPNSVPTVDSTVGVYLDGVYVARITGANLRLIDMERVEVLRGPQGTLFGRNTIGGAISLVSRRPSSSLEGYAEAVVGNYDRRELTGIVNLPISGGSHAFRMVAAHSEHDGYGRSTVVGRELDDDDTDFARAQLRLTPAADWDFNLSADYTRFENGGQLRTLMAASPASSLVTAASGNPDDDIQSYVDPFAREVPANRAGSVRSTVSGASATLSFHGPGWDFKSITAARQLESRAADSDQDATPYDLGTVLQRYDEQDQFSQEFQLSGNALQHRLDWIAGLHYFEEDGLFDQQFLAFVPATSGWAENLPRGTFRNDSLAAYAQLGYAISPRLRVTGGLRVNEDGRQLTSRNARRAGDVETCSLDAELRDSPEVCRATLPERQFRYVPYMLGLDFRPGRRALLYAKVSRGYRAGGYNLRGATEAELGTFDPESVVAYEIGGRADLLDDRLRIELAIFRSLLDDIQLVQREPVEGIALPLLFVQNGGEARIDGGELEVTVLLGGLRLAGSLGIIDAEFTRLKPNVVEVTLDSNFLHTPETTAALAAAWSIPVDLGLIDLQVDYAWRDDIPFAYDPRSIARQQAYGLWNAKAQLRIGGTGLDVSLWARNLTDERYVTRALTSGLYISSSLGDPRTYGMTLRYQFGRD